MEELISIVVPVYNAGKTLRRCVNSLRGQTYRNIEIILVNDGSKDDSLSLCQSFAGEDSRIRVIDKPNGGVSSARNAGLDAAVGDFVMFCDSDDWAEPDWCACMREHYTPGDMTVCEFVWAEVSQTEHLHLEEEVNRRLYMHKSALMCAPYNKIFSKEVIDKNQIRFSRELSLGEDFVFCLTYLCAIEGNIRYLYRKLYNYDTTNDNSLSNKAPSLEQCQLFYKEVSDAMYKLDALDRESLFVRDTLVATHFERYLKVVAKKTDISVVGKLKEAAYVSSLEGYRNTCAQGIRWGNPVYLWVMQRGWTRLGMMYMILILKLKNRI